MRRPYDPATDRDALWEAKRAFETGLADDEQKASAYEAKLTDEYRRRWLAWVDRCVEQQPRCVTVAVTDDDSTAADTAADHHSTAETQQEMAGYVFLLPETLAHIWDAAVLNEIYVRPADRGTGLADELLEDALELAREQTLPMDRIVLDVDRPNERARAFYERHGFDHWGEMIARPLE